MEGFRLAGINNRHSDSSIYDQDITYSGLQKIGVKKFKRMVWYIIADRMSINMPDN